MTTLVVGATGATGRLLVEQLLQRGEAVKAIVRRTGTFNEFITSHPDFTEILASVHDMTVGELAQQVEGCNAIASCLGHNITFKGVFGKPRLLVTDTIRKLCEAVQSTNPAQPVRVVLMNTVGNSNRDLAEKVSFAQRCVIGLLRITVPPLRDNEQAADYLRTRIGQNHETLQWAAVRPDALIDESEVTAYDLYPSPIRSAIFNPGKTSRINVAHFMAELMTDQETWNQWQGQMPVIYNRPE
ncbi:hypothetical protein Enr10x_53560 [Gimesia panareensis]|uniref:NAD(P)-binding domain-containing protein n=1 Tax=Gimesia panareensis TaxID=2527978 RepID=A0A517QEN1_9PLAN|nr:NAD(P)-binding oxidoreductase [Gimesia panareensis]QDT29997.1 hypothetical protein Enr10x_53560 [Gimesia panareensis]